MQLLDEPFTSYDAYRAWRETRPDEEQYDVVGGVPVLSPGPRPRHQVVLYRLMQALDPAKPEGHLILPAPLDWLLWEAPRLQVRQPDLIVVRHEDLLETHLARPPLLVVEVLSPSSIDRDLVLKRDDYACAGLQHYWVVDPDEPRVLVFQRREESLVLVAQGAGDAELPIAEPFTVTLTPSRLVH